MTANPSPMLGFLPEIVFVNPPLLFTKAKRSASNALMPWEARRIAHG